MHPTPLRVDEIVHILKGRIGSNVVPIHTAARLNRMPLGRKPSPFASP